MASTTNTNEHEIEFHHLTWDCVKAALVELAYLLPRDILIYPVPRGGHVAASLLTYHRPDIQIVPSKLTGAYWFDDIVDTGTTMLDAHKFHGRTIALFKREYTYTTPKRLWEPLFCARSFYCNKYVVFPWELDAEIEKLNYKTRIGDK